MISLADDAAESIAILRPNDTQSKEDGDIGSAILPLYSITKTFTAAAVLLCEIDVSTRISRWFDERWVPRGRDISVAHLLTHRSGIRDYFSASEDYANAVAEALRQTNPDDPPSCAWDDETFADHTLRQPLWFEPGTNFGYSNPGYWLLTQILQKETGRSWMELIATLIASPMELESLRYPTDQFAPDLPNYSARWVWPGLLLGSANDVAKFIGSDLVNRLRAQMHPVPGEQTGWRRPHYGFGLMAEPGERFGHNGEGPGYSASAFHFEHSGETICVLMRTEAQPVESSAGSTADPAMRRLLELWKSA